MHQDACCGSGLLDGFVLTFKGPALTKYMHELFDPMLSNGLTEQLQLTLVEICQHIPPLHSAVQDRLLHSLSLILLPSARFSKTIASHDRNRSNPASLQASREMFTVRHLFIHLLGM